MKYIVKKFFGRLTSVICSPVPWKIGHVDAIEKLNGQVRECSSGLLDRVLFNEVPFLSQLYRVKENPIRNVKGGCNWTKSGQQFRKRANVKTPNEISIRADSDMRMHDKARLWVQSFYFNGFCDVWMD